MQKDVVLDMSNTIVVKNNNRLRILWRQNASWYFHVNGCRSLRPLGCIGRDSPARHAHPAYYVSCIPFQPITLDPNRERRQIHVQRFLCHRRTRPEINALSEDSEPVLLSISVGGANDAIGILRDGGKIEFGRVQ